MRGSAAERRCQEEKGGARGSAISPRGVVEATSFGGSATPIGNSTAARATGCSPPRIAGMSVEARRQRVPQGHSVDFLAGMLSSGAWPIDPDEKQISWSGSTAAAAIAPCEVPDKSPCSSNRQATSSAMAVAEILSRSMSRIVFIAGHRIVVAKSHRFNRSQARI